MKIMHIFQEHSAHGGHMLNHLLKICAEPFHNENSFVIEVASNDGHLLTNFAAKQIPCIGIEPAKSAAGQAETLGIPTLNQFFSHALAKSLKLRGQSADLIIANNVIAWSQTSLILQGD